MAGVFRQRLAAHLLGRFKQARARNGGCLFAARRRGNTATGFRRNRRAWLRHRSRSGIDDWARRSIEVAGYRTRRATEASLDGHAYRANDECCPLGLLPNRTLVSAARP